MHQPAQKIWRPWTPEPDKATENVTNNPREAAKATQRGLPASINIAPGITSTAGAAADLDEEMLDDSDTPQEPDELTKLLQRNKKYMTTYKRCSKRVQDQYNFQVVAGNSAEMKTFLEEIWQDQEHPFKINMSFGFILQHVLTGEYIYYYASTNNKLFQTPIPVQVRDDLQIVLQHFETSDLLEYCRRQRPNTKFIVRQITNVFIYVDKVRKYRIGAPPTLPNYLLQRRSLRNFLKDRRGQPYADNLCFFRCLAFHFHKTENGLEPRVRQLYSDYYQRNNAADFKGIELDEIPLLEDRFNINIEVYDLSQSRVSPDDAGLVDENDGDAAVLVDVAKQVFCSRKIYPGPTMNLNLFESHFSLIIKFGAYAGRWSCIKCCTLFDKHFNMMRHQQRCAGCTNVTFVGGGYGQKKSMFELLQEQGREVPDELRFFPYRLAFDFESINVPTPPPETEKKELILATLEPASVSVCSNVPGYDQATCFVSNGDPSELIARLYNYIAEISRRSRELMLEKFEFVLHSLGTYLNDLQQAKDRIDMLTGDGENDDDVNFESDDAESDDEDAIELRVLRDKVARLKIYEKLSSALDKWLSRIVCLGFNTGKFDINLIRKYLFPYLLQEQIEIEQIIKKNNDYMSVLTPHAVFLDIKNYLAAGVSYDAWLKLNDIPQQKGVFPYEWLTDLCKLEQTDLPPKKEFWSTLRQANITDEQYEDLQGTYLDLLCKGFQNHARSSHMVQQFGRGPFYSSG